MIRGKRASSWYPTFIVVAGLIALTACWLILLNKGGAFDKTIGEPQLMFIGTYQKGENYMMFMDQAGKYTVYQASRELASGGGYSDEPGCGSIDGYAIWNSAELDCYPEELAIEYSYDMLFNRIIRSYSSLALNDTANLKYYLEFLNKEPITMIARPNRATDILVYPNGTTIMALGGYIDYSSIKEDLPEIAAAEPSEPEVVG
jgi:hypothetical protein